MLISTELLKKHIILFSLLLTTSLAIAEPLDEFDVDDFFADIPMVLTVSRLEQPTSESPSAVTVIDREMIKASGARSIADIFRLVPGFIVGNLTGNKPAVTYHGLGSTYNRQLQVLIDGRSVYIPSFGGVPWTSLPLILEDIERIEVTRGPNAASYGANSFLAVINITTREAAQETGVNLSLTHSDNQQSINDGYISISKQFTDYDIRFSAKTISDDGFKAFNNEPNHDAKDVTKFNIKSNFLIQQNSQWSIQVGKNNASLAQGDGDVTDIMRHPKTINQYQSLRYEESNNNSSSSITLFHTEHTLKDSFDILIGTVGFDRSSERSEIEYTKTIDHSKKLRTVFGGSYRKDTVDSFFLLGPNQKQSIHVSRLFTHAEYKFDYNKILNIGGMLEDSDIVNSKFSPRIAYVQKLTPEHTIRIAHSKAFRNPILFEQKGWSAFKLNGTDLLLQQVKPNPEIQPEEINSFEIGLYSQIHPTLKADIKLYQYELKNLITYFKTTELNIQGDPLLQFKNNDSSTRVKGMELSLTYKPDYTFFITSGFNTININSDIPDVEHSFPEQTFFILSQFDINKHHSVSASYYYIKNTGWFEYSSNELGNTNKLDMRYAYHFTVNNNTPFTLEIIGQNLLNDYPDFLENNIQEKSFFIKLSNNF